MGLIGAFVFAILQGCIPSIYKPADSKEEVEDKIPAQKHEKAIGPSAPEKKKEEPKKKTDDEKKDDKKDGKSNKTDKKDGKKKEEKGCCASVTNFLSNPFNARMRTTAMVVM